MTVKSITLHQEKKAKDETGLPIEDKNLVKGVFRELSVLGVPVRVQIGAATKAVFIRLMGDTLRNANDQDGIEFYPPITGFPEVEIGFELDEQLYSAVLKAVDVDSGRFVIPTKIKAVQNRSTKRSDVNDLSTHPLIAELRASGARVYGRLKDSNERFIVVIVPLLTMVLEPKQSVQLRVYSAERQTLLRSGVVSFIRNIKEDEAEIVIDLDPAQSNSFKPRLPRWQIVGASELRVFWPNENGLRLNTKVVEAGLAGFAAEVAGEDIEVPPLGAICVIPSINAVARLVWRSGNLLGFDLRVNDPSGLGNWIARLEEWVRPGLGGLAGPKQRQQLLKILIRSGYLRGKKAQVFQTPSLDLLIPMTADTRSWLIRFSKSHTETSPDVHISYLKLSDSSWIIQELGHTVESADGVVTISESMYEFFLREQINATLESHLVAIYDNTSKFNKKFWGEKAALGVGSYSKCSMIDLTAYRKEIAVPERADLGLSLQSASLNSWKESFAKLSEHFDENILHGLGLKKDTFDAPVLRQIIARSSYVLQRQVQFLVKDGEIFGAAIAFGLPTFANLATTANHLWILVRDPSITLDVLRLIFSNKHHSNPMLGATEAVIIPSRDSAESEMNGISGRDYAMYSIPFLEIPRFLSRDA